MPFTPPLSRLLGGVFVAAALVLTSQLSQGTPPAQALYACDVYDASLDAEERAFLTTINGYRAQYGLAPLSVSTNLNRAATWMATDLATSGRWSHTDSLGRAFDVRIRDCGGLAWNGENLASGTVLSSAGSAFELWRTSSGHNANMLTASYRQIGIARVYSASSPYGWYWATDFSSTHDGTDGSAAVWAAASVPQVPVSYSTTARAGMAWPVSGYVSASGVNLTLSPVAGAWEYWLEVGSMPGSKEYYDASLGLWTNAWVGGLPVGGRIYVRVWTLSAAGWLYQDYTYYTTI